MFEDPTGKLSIHFENYILKKLTLTIKYLFHGLERWLDVKSIGC